MNNRRQSKRQKCLLQGRIYFNSRKLSVECMIRDLSGAGARLKVTEAVAFPEMVELYIPPKDEWYRVKIQWRHGDEVGVSFLQDNIASPPLAPSVSFSDLAERVQQLEADVATLQRMVRDLRMERLHRQGSI
jgi:hypothetical protein